MVQDIQDNSLPLGSGTLGLTLVIPNAEPFIASLLGFLLWQACPPCINQLCYGRKAFLALQHQVSGSDSSGILLLFLSFTLRIHAVSHSQLTVGGQLTICTNISEVASLQSVVVSGLWLIEGQRL